MRALPLLLLLAAAPARADFGDIGDAFAKLKAAAIETRRDIAERMNRPPPPVVVPYAPDSTRVQVRDPWNDATQEREYRMGNAPGAVSKIMGFALTETPLPVAPVLSRVFDPFPAAQANRIAGRCVAAHKEWWDRIGCVSHGVHEHFKDHVWDANSRDGLRSFCRSHARAFDATFAALKLDRALSKTVEASTSKMEHVANLVVVTNDTGLQFAYVIDSGWFPGKLFPKNDYANRLHDKNGDGRSEFWTLPRISEHPSYSMMPAR